MNMREEWKPIEGYEKLYEVSNHGRVWSIRRDRVLSSKSGSVHLSKNGVSKLFKVSKLVESHFPMSRSSQVSRSSEGHSMAESLEKAYKVKSERLTMNDTHERTTILLRKDLKERVDELSMDKKGFKTLFYNLAIEKLLNAYEDK